jgi:hypothetical protein
MLYFWELNSNKQNHKSKFANTLLTAYWDYAATEYVYDGLLLSPQSAAMGQFNAVLTTLQSCLYPLIHIVVSQINSALHYIP